MNFLETDLPGVILVEPDVHADDRGFFLETYQSGRYSAGGVTADFVQDNHSYSPRGTLRGLHAQLENPQAKLLRVTEGEAFDVAVDIRVGSPTFGKFFATRLSSENFCQLFIPEGFAHGFCVTSAVCQLEYKCSNFYDPRSEIVVAWNDPDIGIPWPVRTPRLSERDAAGTSLRDLGERLPRYDR